MDTKELVDWIKELDSQGKIKLFYSSKTWRKIRAEVLDEQNNECQRCKLLGKYTEAITVHHIKHLKDRPELALTKSNLMSVCKECHNILHPEKSKFYKSNKQLINEERW